MIIVNNNPAAKNLPYSPLGMPIANGMYPTDLRLPILSLP